MKTTILASNNKHKIREFREIFPNENILSLADIGFYDDIIEDGKSFVENSLIKAKTVQSFLKEKGIVQRILLLIEVFTEYDETFIEYFDEALVMLETIVTA